MVELELTLMSQSLEYIQELTTLMQTFEAKSHIRVRIRPLSWSEGWSVLSQAALYGQGPDVSEVGTTWVADLVGMNALLRFTDTLVDSLGGKSAHLTQAWESCSLLGEANVWAIPWTFGVRLLYYRRDWLERTGIDPQRAFASSADLYNTLAAMQAQGIQHPWTVSTHPSLNTLHRIASWVWGAKGDFISSDGKRILFTEDRTIEAIAAYFSLGKFLGPRAEELTDGSALDLFWGGNAGATIDGHWIYLAQRPSRNPEILQNLGAAPVPGIPFIGGSNLIAWRNTAHPEATMELVRYLTGPEVEMACYHSTGLLPARTTLLEIPEVADQPFSQPIYQSLTNGRTWPMLRFASMIENRLDEAFGMIWKDVLDNEEADIKRIVRTHLLPVQRRLQVTLSS